MIFCIPPREKCKKISLWIEQTVWPVIQNPGQASQADQGSQRTDFFWCAHHQANDTIASWSLIQLPFLFARHKRELRHREDQIRNTIFSTYICLFHWDLLRRLLKTSTIPTKNRCCAVTGGNTTNHFTTCWTPYICCYIFGFY